LAINPSNRYCLEILDSVLQKLSSSLAFQKLPGLSLLPFEKLDQQLYDKLAKHDSNLEFPDFELDDSDDILYDTSLVTTDISPAREKVIPAGMLTRGRLKGRSSNILPSSPPSSSAAAPRGLLSFHSSPNDPFVSTSPPRLTRRLFASRDMGPSSDLEDSRPIERSRVGSDSIFNEEDDMDLDDSS
jgi:hypothetical protein